MDQSPDAGEDPRATDRHHDRRSGESTAIVLSTCDDSDKGYRVGVWFRLDWGSVSGAILDCGFMSGEFSNQAIKTFNFFIFFKLHCIQQILTTMFTHFVKSVLEYKSHK